MLYKTQGIVLHSLPYKDVYTILHIYTKDFGRVSYMVARKRGKRSSVSQALFMPLSVLDLEVEHQNKRDHKRKYDIHVCVGLLFYKRIFLFPSEDCKAHFFISFPFI